MKYKRNSATEWEESNLLPVQFASLIEPEKFDIADNIIEIRKYCKSFSEMLYEASAHQKDSFEI